MTGTSVVYILGSLIGLGADPFLWIAVIVAAFNRRWWLPPLVGAIAAILSDLLVRSISPTGYDGEYFPMRVVTGIVVGLLVAGIKALFRKARSRPAMAPQQPRPEAPGARVASTPPPQPQKPGEPQRPITEIWGNRRPD